MHVLFKLDNACHYLELWCCGLASGNKILFHVLVNLEAFTLVVIIAVRVTAFPLPWKNIPPQHPE